MDVPSNQRRPFTNRRGRGSPCNSHAIDREPLLQVGLDGEGELLYGYVPILGRTLRVRNQELAYEYDPDRARELLEEAGWTNDEQGAVRSRDGEELELDLLSFPLGLLENMAEAIQSMLTDVGIATDYRAPEASTFYTDLENDEHHIATSGGSFTPFASSVLSRYYHGVSGSPREGVTTRITTTPK
ncbi:hypothetical protein D8S78_22320 [Natrialba swarupiae]|nr:hypothetical protein [Natrialba swarupiae]